MRTLVAALEWEQRDYRRIEEFVDNYLGAQDRVLADEEAYYAVKESAEQVMFPPHFPVMPQETRTRVTAILARPEHLSRFVAAAGGGVWRPVAELDVSRPEGKMRWFTRARMYHLVVLRRDGVSR
jgi:hypothetical protein